MPRGDVCGNKGSLLVVLSLILARGGERGTQTIGCQSNSQYETRRLSSHRARK